MARVILCPRKHVIKPNAGLSFLDPVEPLCRGLNGLWVYNERGGGGSWDISGKGNRAVFNGGVTWDASFAYGASAKLDGVSGSYIHAPLPAGVVSGSAWSATIVAKFNTTPALQNFFNFNDGVNSLGICYFWTSPNNSMLFKVLTNDATTTGLTIDPDITKWHVYTFTHDGSAARGKIYVDGFDYSLSNGVGLSNIANAGFDISRGAANLESQSSIALVALHNRVLSPLECFSIGKNPFVFLMTNHKFSVHTPAVVAGSYPGAFINNPINL